MKMYRHLQTDIAELLRQARGLAVRSVNAVMTASYWEVGRRIVEAEQKGKRRAAYGEQLIQQLAVDLTAEFGRGFSEVNLKQMRRFHLVWPIQKIRQTLSAEFNRREQDHEMTLLLEPLTLTELAQAFPLSWSAYVCLLSVESEVARQFYEQEALRCGWSVRQLKRHIDSQFFERSLRSKNKKAMLNKGAMMKAEVAMDLADIVKDPYVLEFLDLKDEYSERDLDEALIRRLEDSLMELGDDFAFVGRQKRLRLDDEWFRVDLVFYHRRLKGAAQAHYALEGLPNKVLASRYQTLLPSTDQLADELRRVSANLTQRGRS
jgi:predicted nuclease of restriction endonuclease-like (RecB) superfamily